jgi:hypothetical protein
MRPNALAEELGHEDVKRKRARSAEKPELAAKGSGFGSCRPGFLGLAARVCSVIER